MIMRFLLLLLASLSLSTSFAEEDTMESAAASLRSDLDAALEELAVLRDGIAEEKVPLVREKNRLQSELLAKRREFERMQRLRDNRSVDLDALQGELKSRKDEIEYIGSLLSEYLQRFEAGIHVSELQLYQGKIREVQAESGESDPFHSENRRNQLAAVFTTLERLESMIGGTSFEGEALADGGNLEKGRFSAVGPIVIFSAGNNGSSGLVTRRAGSLRPNVLPLGKNFSVGIHDLTRTGAGDLPVDPTLGNALKRASTRTTFWEHIQKGGIVMIPILLLALVALVVAITKWIQMSRIRSVSSATLQSILDELKRGEHEKATAIARSVTGPVGEVLASAVENAHEKKELIEEILFERMLHAQPKLERFLPFIALTAATAPLLGLLGTVTGMINTFQLITIFGTGDAKTLSGGISEALITTEFGLCIAIAALLAHALLSRKTKAILASMEQAGIGFINGLSSETD